jgi:hypothetical protein
VRRRSSQILVDEKSELRLSLVLSKGQLHLKQTDLLGLNLLDRIGLKEKC